VDSFNLPLYRPFKGEVREIIEDEGSFNIDKLETFEVDWDNSDTSEDDQYCASGQNVAKWNRAHAGYSFWSWNGNGQLICKVCTACGRASVHRKDSRLSYSPFHDKEVDL